MWSLEVLFPHWSWVSLEVMSCQTKFSSSVINELLMRYFLSKNTRPGGGCDEPWQKDVSAAGGFHLCGWKIRSQVHPASRGQSSSKRLISLDFLRTSVFKSWSSIKKNNRLRDSMWPHGRRLFQLSLRASTINLRTSWREKQSSSCFTAAHTPTWQTKPDVVSCLDSEDCSSDSTRKRLCDGKMKWTHCVHLCVTWRVQRTRRRNDRRTDMSSDLGDLDVIN